MAPYLYRPLDVERSEIRLLKLMPSTDVPRIEIIHVSLDDNPEYVALSYAWGDANTTKRVEIVDRACALDDISLEANRSDFQATYSLEAALRQLIDVDLVEEENRTKGENSDQIENTRSPLLWADAICINQNDDIEKGHQIRLMARIYTQCSLVCVWLGEAADDSDLVMDMASVFLKRLLDASSSDEHHRDGALKILSDAVDFGLSEDADELLRCARAVQHFLWRDWWSRLWIVQEIVLAPKDVVLCGSKTSTLSSTLMFLQQFWNRSSRDLEVLREDLQSDGVPELAELRSLVLEMVDIVASQLKVIWERQVYQTTVIEQLKKSIKTHGFPSFRGLMSLPEGRGYTNPKDAVYALLSLTKDAKDWKVDYGSSRLEVFEYATRNVIKLENSLDIICHAYQCKHEVQQQYSWLPRFDYEELACGCSLLARFSLTKGRTSNDLTTDKISSPYSASRGYFPVIASEDYGNELKSFGIIADEVEYLFEEPSWEEFRNTFTTYKQRIPDQWFSVLSNTKKIQNDSAALGSIPIEPDNFHSFWRTMVANRESDEAKTPPPLIWGEVFRAWVEITGGTGFSAPLEVEKLPSGLAEHTSILNELSTRVGVAIGGNKTLIRTKSGRFGLARTQSRAGDFIFVLMGCSVPLILRRLLGKPGEYVLIGESYIDGIMDGDIIDDFEAGKYPLEEIVIV